LYFLSPILLLLLVLAILVPRFTSDFREIRQQIEVATKQQKLIEDELAQKKAQDNLRKVAYLTGKFDPAEREDFAPIPDNINIGGYKMFLRKEALDAFSRMEEAAKIDGVNLKIASATRNFDYQKKLWENKWTGYTLASGQDLSKTTPDSAERFAKILEWSAVPGTSRHHWGTDVDLNNANPEYFNTSSGKKVYEWLVVNAPIFGFCQTYTEQSERNYTGYEEEKWHWSYMPLARTFLQEYKDLVKESDISGFLGDEYVSDFNLIDDYVLNISPGCLQDY